MLGRQRLIKVVSAIAVSMLSGGAAWGMTAATSSHSPRAAGTEVDSSTSSSVDETSSTESTTSSTEATTTTDDSTTTTTEETTTSIATSPTSPATCNHGAEVSRVAHEAPKGDGNEHGKAVSEAAHHKCGDAADAADPTETSDVESEQDVESEHHVESEHDDAAEQGLEHGGGSGHD